MRPYYDDTRAHREPSEAEQLEIIRAALKTASNPRQEQTMRTPYQDLAKHAGVDHDLVTAGSWPRWRDHQDIVHQDGVTVWRSQPYHLDGEAFEHFRILETLGWKVSVSGHSEHWPDCLTVSVSRGGYHHDPAYGKHR